MSRPDWESRYTAGDKPWDVGAPDPNLIELVEGRPIPAGAALEVGCGTGTNAIWLAQAGFQVLGVDLSPAALAAAEAKAAAAGVTGCRFARLDFLQAAERELAGGPYDFVFDRGCFHVFDDAAEQAAFAARVAALLRPGGLWLSLIGSTEGPARDHGPPRRSARDVLQAIEPALAVLELRSIDFVANLPSPAQGWRCLAQRRAVPAQPSTRR